jgi:hypothetical protein
LASKKAQGRSDHPIYNNMEEVNWSSHILRMNCLPKHAMEGNIDGARRGRRRKQLLDDIKERRDTGK